MQTTTRWLTLGSILAAAAILLPVVAAFAQDQGAGTAPAEAQAAENQPAPAAVTDRESISPPLVPNPALDRVVDINFVETPLAEVASMLRADFALEVQLDTIGLEELGIAGDEPLSFAANGLPLQDALTLMLREMELAWVPHPWGVLITSEDVASNMLITRFYRFTDFAPERRWDAEDCIELLVDVIDPDVWEENGGPCSAHHAGGGLLSVEATPAIHRQVAALLTALRELPSADKSTQSVIVGNRNRAHNGWQDRPVDLSFQDTPLSDVAEFLREEVGLPVMFDRVGLEEIGLGMDEVITFECRGMQLGHAMELMLRPVELQTVPKHGVLLITSEDVARNELEIRLYPAGDLFPSLEAKYEPLLDVITSTVKFEVWEDNGGPGCVTYSPMHRALVVMAPAATQERVEKFLVNLRNVLGDDDYQQLLRQQEEAEKQLEKLLPKRSQTMLGGGLSGGGGLGAGGGNAAPLSKNAPPASTPPASAGGGVF